MLDSPRRVQHFFLLSRASMVFGGGAPPNFTREIVLDGRGVYTDHYRLILCDHHAKDVDLIWKVSSSH